MRAFVERIAKVREFIDGGKRLHKWPYAEFGTARCADDCPACAALAALDRVERLATQMEIVLRAAYHYYPKDTPMSESMLAALPAREEGALDETSWTTGAA